MIDSNDFTPHLIRNNLGPVVQVPCSYLKDFLNYLSDTKRVELINPANEALAMGIASGYYLSTGKVPIVAIQNSGLMNTFNALTSLNQMYNIPVLQGRAAVLHSNPFHPSFLSSATSFSAC